MQSCSHSGSSPGVHIWAAIYITHYVLYVSHIQFHRKQLNVLWMCLSNSCTADALALEQARCSGVRCRRYSWATNSCLTLFTSVLRSKWITCWLGDLALVESPVFLPLPESRGSWHAAMCNGVRPSFVRTLRSSFGGVCVCMCMCMGMRGSFCLEHHLYYWTANIYSYMYTGICLNNVWSRALHFSMPCTVRAYGTHSF